ncbi:MAG: hypothetical protein U0271_05465 [Polyangiaceae bacterium]
MKRSPLVLMVALAVLGCGDKKSPSQSESKDTKTTSSARAKSSARPSASASIASPSAAPPPAVSEAPVAAKFVRERPTEPASVDACAYIGGMGFACLDALMAEKDPIKQRYMRRLSDADARQSLESMKQGQPNGVAHAEMAMACAESGACKQKDADGNMMDDGYACLTKAQSLAFDKDPAAQAAHKRACECDPERAQIPVMGGYLACDGKDKPVTRGEGLSIEEANDIRACGECDGEKGPAACQREIDRLKDKDRELSDYLRTVHVPRCGQP